MSNSVEKPMGLRARLDRGMLKLIGPATILFGVALIARLSTQDIIAGLLLVYAGLVATPATRMFATRGYLGFTRLRAFAAQLLWLALCVLGAILAYPT